MGTPLGPHPAPLPHYPGTHHPPGRYSALHQHGLQGPAQLHQAPFGFNALAMHRVRWVSGVTVCVISGVISGVTVVSDKPSVLMPKRDWISAKLTKRIN